MSAPFKILQAHHTGVTVRDIDASLAFFVGVLGFTLQYRARRTGSFAEEVTGVPEAEIEVPSTSTISTRPWPISPSTIGTPSAARRRSPAAPAPTPASSTSATPTARRWSSCSRRPPRVQAGVRLAARARSWYLRRARSR